VSDPNQLAYCPSCSYANAADSRFCQKCGTQLIQSCLSCRAENRLDAEFCRTCGVRLSEARLGITEEGAREWWSHFWSFAGFAHIWTPSGYGTTGFLPVARRIMDATTPRPLKKGENTPLHLVIADRDWCLRTARFDDVVIKHGMLWAARTAFAVFDFTRQDAYSVPYEDLDDAHREADVITLHISQGRVVDLQLRVPRPSKASQYRGFAWDVLNILADTAAGDSTASELRSQRSDRESEEWWKKHQMADDFVASILNFFSEVINEKRKLAED